MKIIFASQLLKLRKAKGLSQEALAADLDVTRQTISKWELGEATPDLNKIQSIADYFAVPAQELLFGTQEAASSATMEEVHTMNGWEFLSRYWWLLFAIIPLLVWAIQSIMDP